jgi:hypothetical protein
MNNLYILENEVEDLMKNHDVIIRILYIFNDFKIAIFHFLFINYTTQIYLRRWYSYSKVVGETHNHSKKDYDIFSL